MSDLPFETYPETTGSTSLQTRQNLRDKRDELFRVYDHELEYMVTTDAGRLWNGLERHFNDLGILSDEKLHDDDKDIFGEIINELQLKPESLDPNNPENLESAALLLGFVQLARTTDQVIFENWRQNRSLVARIDEVYPNHLRINSPEPSQSTVVTWSQVFGLALRELTIKCYPDSDGSFDWLKENVAESNGLATLPLTYAEAAAHITTWIGNEFPNHTHFQLPYGGAASHLGLAIVFKDSSQKTIAHELNHLNSSSFHHGHLLGTSLTEGMTDFNAAVQTNEMSPDFISSFSMKGYRDEVRLIVELMTRYPDLIQIINNRFDAITSVSTVNWINAIVSKFGWDGLAQLYLAHPSPEKYIETDINLTKTKQVGISLNLFGYTY